ncbi:hypothetical protein DFH27DRAFT_116352 [Peziza echinospora]|nr:hypothetical protein DFH27DRAFT_116352 [Peziza echinospora]
MSDIQLHDRLQASTRVEPEHAQLQPQQLDSTASQQAPALPAYTTSQPPPPPPPSPPPPPLPPSPVFFFNGRTKSLQALPPHALPPPAINAQNPLASAPLPSPRAPTPAHNLIFDDPPPTDEPLPAYSRYPKKGVDTTLTPVHGLSEEDGGSPSSARPLKKVCGIHVRTIILGIGIMIFIGVIVGVVMGWRLKTRTGQWDQDADGHINYDDFPNYPDSPRYTRPDHTRPTPTVDSTIPFPTATGIGVGLGENGDGGSVNDELEAALPLVPQLKPGGGV